MDDKYKLVYGSIGKHTHDEIIIETKPKPLLFIKETNQWFDGEEYFDAGTVTVYPYEDFQDSKCCGPTMYLGNHIVDNCIYDEIERIPNCTVSVLKCRRCNHIEIEWQRTDEIYE